MKRLVPAVHRRLSTLSVDALASREKARAAVSALSARELEVLSEAVGARL